MYNTINQFNVYNHIMYMICTNEYKMCVIYLNKFGWGWWWVVAGSGGWWWMVVVVVGATKSRRKNCGGGGDGW